MKSSLFLPSLMLISLPALGAAPAIVTMHSVDAEGVGAEVGKVRIEETPHGLAFYPELKDLKTGLHGFHVHKNPSCEPGEKDGKQQAAAAAGDHLDSLYAKKHDEPWGDGHIGDLPALTVAAIGSATTPVLAPRLTMADVRDHALMIHSGGDNHSDKPQPSGGGGTPIACGVIKG